MHCANLWVFEYLHPPVLRTRPHLTEKQKMARKETPPRTSPLATQLGCSKKTTRIWAASKKGGCACTPSTGTLSPHDNRFLQLGVQRSLSGLGPLLDLKHAFDQRRWERDQCCQMQESLCLCSLPRLLKCVLVNTHTEAMALLIQHSAKERPVEQSIQKKDSKLLLTNELLGH